MVTSKQPRYPGA